MRRRSVVWSCGVVVTVVASVIGVVGVPSPVGAQGGIDSVMLNPDPPIVWAPFSIEIEASGCEADASVSFSAHLEQISGDVVRSVELGSVDATADASGDVAASLSLSTAYPGRWEVWMDEGCDFTPDLPMASFEIASPDDLRLTATTGGDLQLGKPFDLHIEGTGCPGIGVDWSFGAWVEPMWGYTAAHGAATPVDGAWSADASGALATQIDTSSGLRPASLSVIGTCVFVDGVQVPINGVALPLLPAETTTIDPGIVTNPRYAG